MKLTAHFERNLEEIERFLADADTPQTFDALLTELTDTVAPNLQRFPTMGRQFLGRPVRSVEVANGAERLTAKLKDLDTNGELREYVMSHYLLLYALIDGMVYLLSIRHHRQLSFDFQALWPVGP
jgi:plasmid stabilization system protein ParE